MSALRSAHRSADNPLSARPTRGAAQTLNPDTRVAWERARQAALAVGIVKALYLPALSAIAVGGGQRDTGSTQVGAIT